MELRAGGPAGGTVRTEFQKGHCGEFSTRVGGDGGSLERVSPRGLGAPPGIWSSLRMGEGGKYLFLPTRMNPQSIVKNPQKGLTSILEKN